MTAQENDRSTRQDQQEVAEFIDDLRKLRLDAGQPSFRVMSRSACCSHTALANVLTSGRLPTLAVTLAFVRACDGDEETWTERWTAVNGASQAGKTAMAVVDRPPKSRLSDSALLGNRAFERVPGSAGPSPNKPRRYPGRAARMVILLLLVLGGWTTAAMTIVARPTSPGPSAHSVFLGPVDLGRYCQSTGFTGVSLDGPTAYDWHCVQAPSTRESLSVIEACRWQYRSDTAIARYAEIQNPDSWQCWDHVVVLGRIDLIRYCQASGFTGDAIDGPTADQWQCIGSDGQKLTVDPDSSCRWQYGSRALVATVPHYLQPWEHWDCWG